MIDTKDIGIGDCKWIKWVELDPQDKNLFDIDHLLEPMKPFLKKLEINCVAACCGIDAFSFWPEDIKSASKSCDVMQLNVQLARIKEEVTKSNNRIVISKTLNNVFDRKVFIELVNHIIGQLEQ